MSIQDYLLKNPHKKLLYNPLAAEFGISNMDEVNDFIKNQMPKFKMVSRRVKPVTQELAWMSWSCYGLGFGLGLGRALGLL